LLRKLVAFAIDLGIDIVLRIGRHNPIRAGRRKIGIGFDGHNTGGSALRRPLGDDRRCIGRRVGASARWHQSGIRTARGSGCRPIRLTMCRASQQCERQRETPDVKSGLNAAEHSGTVCLGREHGPPSGGAWGGYDSQIVGPWTERKHPSQSDAE
jgi:hypothetical protein